MRTNYLGKLNVSNQATKALQLLKELQWADWAMIYFFGQRMFTSLFSAVIGTKGILLSMGVLALLYAMTLLEAWRLRSLKGIRTFILLVLLVMVLILGTMTFNQQAMEWMMDFNYGIFTKTFDVRKGLFGAFVILMVRRPDNLLRNLRIAAGISFVYLLFQLGLFVVTGSWANYYIMEDQQSSTLMYNLSFGYEMMFAALVFLGSALESGKRSEWAAGIAGVMIAFLFGSRGVILPVGTFLVFVFFFRLNRTWKIRIAAAGILMAALILGWNLLRGFTGGTITTGIRNLDMLLSSAFTDDNGRTKIWDLAIRAIQQKFPLGYGVYGDRPFVGSFFRWGYSHNIALELLVSFGIFGLVFLGGLIWLIGRQFIRCQSQSGRLLLMIMIAMNAKLLISDSFWHSSFFWALLGLVLVLSEQTDQPPELSGEAATVGPEKYRGGAFLKGRRGFWLLTGLGLVLNLGLLVVVVNQAVANQKYKPVVFDRPTVIIALQDMNGKALHMGVTELARRGLSASVFVDPKVMPVQEIKGLDRLAEADLHLGLNYRPLRLDSFPPIEQYLELSRNKFSDSGRSGALALSTTVENIHPDMLQYLRQQSDAMILKSRRRDSFTYESVTQNDLYKLDSLNASINDLNLSRRQPYIASQIQLVKEKEALLILYWRNLSVQPVNLKNNDTYAKFDYYKDTLDLLQANGFEFITITELLDRARMSEEEKTLKSLIVNSDIYRTLR